ncbi:MAG: ComEC/Rec2 family competence protein [Flavobacteriaceae bacterium]
MQFFRFIPIKLSLVLVIGIVLGNVLDFKIIPALLLLLPILVVLGFVFYGQYKPHSKAFGILAGLAILGIGIFTVSLAKPQNKPQHYSHRDFQGQHLWKLKIDQVLKSTSFSNRYLAHPIALDGHGTYGNLLVNISIDSTVGNLKVDDEFYCYRSIAPINPPLNPFQFDYKKYMSQLGVSHQIRLKKEEYILVAHPSPTLRGRTAALRDKIILKLKSAHFGSEELGIMQALLLGQRNDISEDTYNNYKNAGAVHILAVSGLHIGILLMLLQLLFRPLERLRHGKTLKLGLIVLLLWAYAFLAGMSASIVRAVTMFSFVAYALYLNRPSNTFNILALSMFFILLAFDPNLLFQVGFQMSYAAVFAIVWIYPLLQKFWSPKNYLVQKIWQLLSVSFAAQLGVLPISLYYFHQFPGLFFVSNLLIVPFIGLVLGLGILVIVLALIDTLPLFVARIYDKLIALMNAIVDWVAAQEVFIFKNIPFDAVQLTLAYVVLIALVLFAIKAHFKRALALFIAILGFQTWLYITGFQTRRQEVLLLAHQTKNTLLLYQSGQKLAVFSEDTTRTERIVTDYQVAKRITSIDYPPLQNSYDWKNKSLLIIDGSGVYPTDVAGPDYLLLRQSPKLNLERTIDSLRPKTILADGSNYPSVIKSWQTTSKEMGIPFHYTGEKGVFEFDLDD